MVEATSVSGHGWYVVRVYSGCEESAIKQIKNDAALRNLSDYFSDFYYPAPAVSEASESSDKKRPKVKSLYPGYILVKMLMTEITWNLVRSVPKVLNFLGSDSKNPKPLSQSEVDEIISNVQKNTVSSGQSDLFAVGDFAKVKSGSFKGFKGEIRFIDNSAQSVKVAISVFNRETELVLGFIDIEKVS